MSKQVMDRIEYLVLLVAEFAAHSRVSEAMAQFRAEFEDAAPVVNVYLYSESH